MILEARLLRLHSVINVQATRIHLNMIGRLELNQIPCGHNLLKCERGLTGSMTQGEMYLYLPQLP